MSMLPKSLFTHLGATKNMVPMPRRVADLVVAEEERSERLISWVQLAIVSTFAALYVLAPRPSDAGGSLAVGLVIAAYVAFTLFRLGAAYRGFLPGWLLVASMMADVALLYTLIWTFHLAYEQPAPFYLKAPTFAYIFVFIAVRALRFDPRFVISQGIFAAFGWVVMVAYAVEHGGMESITRSFVAYLTSNVVLIGAEFDKIFTVLLVTGVLALALYRARQTLLTAVREGAARRDMNRFFGAGVADAIAMSEDLAAGDATDRDAAVLMLDLRGFSPYAAGRAPQEVVATLTAYHRLVVPIIEARGGVVDKFLGDGVMATFGAVRPSASAAADALGALAEVMDQREAWRAAHPELAINGAVAAGRMVAATLGNEERLEFTVIGAPANLAAKLEKTNKATRTAALTTAETFERARSEGFQRTCRPLGLTSVAGVDTPLDLVSVA